MKLSNKRGQAAHKFSFQTAEQKQWQTLHQIFCSHCVHSFCVQ